MICLTSFIYSMRSSLYPREAASWETGLGDHFHADRGFPDSSVSKEFACNAGDPSSIPGLGRSPGEGIGYPLQYSWASLVAQLVKNPPTMWEAWGSIPRLGRCPGEGKGYPLQYSGLENSMDCPRGCKESVYDWATFTFTPCWYADILLLIRGNNIQSFSCSTCAICYLSYL